jgi:hypothetical protein
LDGYFEGAGNSLCEQVKLLLEKYSAEEIKTMLEALDLEDHTGSEVQHFKTEDLIGFIEGKIIYKHDEDGDTDYVYDLDFRHKYMYGKDEGDNDYECSLTFDEIKAGVNLTDRVDMAHTDRADEEDEEDDEDNEDEDEDEDDDDEDDEED